MKTQASYPKDEILIATKRESQERSRALVQSGKRSQESMFLVAPEIARTAKVRHRTYDLCFD